MRSSTGWAALCSAPDFTDHGVCMKLIVVLPLLLSSVFGQSRPRMDPVPTLASTIETAGPVANYGPPTVTDRVKWFALTTAGSLSLLAVGPLNSGWGTMLNKPKEYGPHWEGFAERYGVRLTGVSTGNAMEAGLGALWGEDPRYFRAEDEPFGSRVNNIAKMTFAARRHDGQLTPAFARCIAIPGNNFLSNTWRPDSEATTPAALRRTLFGFLGRMGGNAFQEFWPDVRQKL